MNGGTGEGSRFAGYENKARYHDKGRKIWQNLFSELLVVTESRECVVKEGKSMYAVKALI